MLDYGHQQKRLTDQQNKEQSAGVKAATLVPSAVLQLIKKMTKWMTVLVGISAMSSF